MVNKVVIKEIESPMIEANGIRYELLCEFQAKDGAFQRVYVQEGGKDVIIELSKDSAIVDLFSVEDNKVKALFDYIEATIAKDDGLVCWCSGVMELYLEKASNEGGRYSLLRNSMDSNVRIPLFYRQKALDVESTRKIAEHSAEVEYLVEPEEHREHEESGLTDLGLDNDWISEPKMTQAESLPAGWKWVDYDDCSGHLESPDGKKYFDYDRQSYYASGNIECRETEADRYGPFFDFDKVGSFSEFKERAERIVAEKYLGRSNAAQLAIDNEKLIIDESLRDDFNGDYGGQVDGVDLGSSPEWDEHFWTPRKIVQASSLPEGWKWVDYSDLSGHLEGPDGKKYFEYDVNVASYVEFKDNDGDWCRLDGNLTEFKEYAEQSVREHILNDREGDKNMGGLKFYVVEDKWLIVDDPAYFDNVAAAYEKFQELCVPGKKLPALGVQVADGMVDLLHGVNGEAVLVPDIYRKDLNWSEPMKAALDDIEAAARWLVLEGGNVLYEYQNDILPVWAQGDMKVLVPVTLGEKAPSSYCDDKILKTTVANGLDAIDSVYLEMHGWVAYDELLRHPKEYVADGTIKLQYLNVNYVLEKNVVGIDGQMDISPCEFRDMVERINKPYQVIAFDSAEYVGLYKEKYEFIVASYDSGAAAIQGMQQIAERRGDVSLVVQSKGSGHLISSHNGKQALVDGIISDASARAGKSERNGIEQERLH